MPGAPDVAGFTASALALLELTGRALRLRPLESGDFEQWRDAQSRNRSRLDAVNPAGWNDAASAVDSQEAFDELVGYLDALRERDEGYAFAMFAGDELVGEIDLGAIVREPLQTAMLGLWLDENQVGKGYAEEAFFQMCRFGFEELGLHRLEALALPENEAVKGALRKAGIRSEGMAQRAREVNGEWRDHERYAITAEEWEGRRDEALRQWVE
jgi:ribosomal-protein-alanine N-acetyltransferase